MLAWSAGSAATMATPEGAMPPPAAAGRRNGCRVGNPSSGRKPAHGLLSYLTEHRTTLFESEAPRPFAQRHRRHRGH